MNHSSNPQVHLIVRGGQWGVQLDVRTFPIQCPTCRSFASTLFQHKGSRYGYVGSRDCECGAEIHLTDSDNIVDYIKCAGKDKSITLEFSNIFSLNSAAFERLKANLGYDIFEKHLEETIALSELNREIEETYGIIASPVEKEFPLPEEVKKWLGILRRKRSQ